MLRYFVGSIPAVIMLAVALPPALYAYKMYKTDFSNPDGPTAATIAFGFTVGAFLWMCLVLFVFLIRG